MSKPAREHIARCTVHLEGNKDGEKDAAVGATNARCLPDGRDKWTEDWAQLAYGWWTLAARSDRTGARIMTPPLGRGGLLAEKGRWAVG